MSIVVDPKNPHKYPEPPRKYPDWLEATFTDPNAPVPESVLEEHRVKIKPWMRQPPTPGKIFGAEPIPAEKYVPPPMMIKQRAKIPVKFIALNAFDKPISGLPIRVNSENLMTKEKGEASIEVYQGHSLDFCTGLHGWNTPNGAKRRVRLNNMVPLAQNFTVSTPIIVYLFPESGTFRVNGKTYAQSIIYTPP